VADLIITQYIEIDFHNRYRRFVITLSHSDVPIKGTWRVALCAFHFLNLFSREAEARKVRMISGRI
jgi:hypothetical protein